MSDTQTTPAPPSKPPITERHKQVAHLIGARPFVSTVSALLKARGIKIGAERVHLIVLDLAAHLPNPDDIAPRVLVVLWAPRIRWEWEARSARKRS